MRSARSRRCGSTRPEAHLHVYGDGAQRAELEALAAELGTGGWPSCFTGHASDTAQAWAEADVFVLASTNEGQPLVVLEALAAGVPVVSYDMPYGPRDTLALGGGMLVPDGEVARARRCARRGHRRPRRAGSALGRGARRREDDGCRGLDAAMGAAVRAALQSRVAGPAAVAADAP